VRFETNESANDRWGRADLAAALYAVGAKRVRLRAAYGQRNLPHVVTFSANCADHADRLADAAYISLVKEGELSLPALFVRSYKRNKV